MKTSKVLQTFSAALAFQATAEASHYPKSEKGESSAGVVAEAKLGGAASHSDEAISTTANIKLSHAEAEFHLEIAPQATWDNKTIRRYRELAIKEATGTLNRSDATELKYLEKLRGRFETPLSGEEIIAQYRQQRIGSEMLEVLNRYVRVVPQRENTTKTKSS